MKTAKNFNTIMAEELKKFNPYHDKNGRFCSANGASFVTIRTKDPSKQHLADASNARMKEAYAEEQKAKAPKIAGVVKGEAMSFDDANNGKTNPNYKLGGGYKTNCQTCVVAMEARRRGYDVEAKAKSTTEQEALARDYTLSWIDPETGKHPKKETDRSISTPKKTYKWLDSRIKQGERYIFMHSNKNTQRRGHIISVERDEDGSLMLHDPQSGYSYIGQDPIEYYCERCIKYRKTYRGYTYVVPPEILRVDNLDFDQDMVDSILQPAGN